VTAVRTLIIEADGASRGNPGAASYGTVVRDGDTGELLAELAEAIGHATNNVAEYRGVIAGLEAARQLDLDARIEVRMDSKLVVEQLSGRWQVKHPAMKPLFERARRTFPVNGVTFAWVPRSQNKHADKLANQALDAAARGEVWRSKTPLGGTRRTGGAEGGGPAGDGGHTVGSEGAGSDSAGSEGAGFDVASDSYSSAGEQGSLFDDERHERHERAAAPAAGWADLGTPTRLLLLRHGVTPLTGEKRFSGLGGDPDLIPEGLAQAHAAAQRLAGGPGRPGDPRYGRIDAIIASPLRRAQQTALAVADATGLELRLEAGFRELDFGAFEGLTFAEARERYAQELADFLSSPKIPAPGGESVEQVAARAAVARDRTIVRFPRKTVLIVTHVTPIKTLICQALGAPLGAVHRMELAAASLSVIDYYSDGVANVRCVNDTAHL
jgi:broad specificity phosphatase PhoE/ribonuclease HI